MILEGSINKIVRDFKPYPVFSDLDLFIQFIKHFSSLMCLLFIRGK